MTTPQAPYETVTTPRLSEARLPGGADTLALVTLDNGLPPIGPHARPATFGPHGLDLLDAALDTLAARAGEGAITAVALTGTAFVFSTGADLALAAGVTDRAEAAATLRRGHQVFRRLAELPVPTFAFLNGVAIGGGLELALHCTYRTVSRGAPALALPEVSLGLVPAWGGLPEALRLLGPDRTVTLLLDHPLDHRRMLTGPQAHAFGLADTLLEPSRFLDRSLAWAADVLTGRHKVTRPAPQDHDDQWDAALARAAGLVTARTHDALPAARHALGLLRQARTATPGELRTAAERAATDLFTGPEFRDSLYALGLTRTRAATHPRRPDPAPARTVRRPALLGDGAAGLTLAALLVERLALPLTVHHPDPENRAAAVAALHRHLDGAVAAGRLTPDSARRRAGLVTAAATPGALAGTDLLIDALPADGPATGRLLRRAEAALAAGAPVLVTTARTVAATAAALADPGRAVGLRPTPGPAGPAAGAELSRTPATDPAAAATAAALATRLDLPCLPVGDHPGTVGEHLRRAFREALRTHARAEDLDAVLAPLALPRSPFAAHPGAPGPAEGPAGSPAGGPSGTDPRALELALGALARTIDTLLADGVLAGPADADLALLSGGDWPFHLGGITPYLDRSGIAADTLGRTFGPPR
ncbi:enoyl-CoA hydratase-related protein [Kitasatospora sp. NPDC056327]|uniref:enoyl-CoA hydratase-related protein n=1 Tax=Kitasatospora sp. NPDC056327 TaxID=3345785 RepID=UPI0035DB8BF0